MIPAVKRYFDHRSRDWRSTWTDKLDTPYGRRCAWRDLLIHDHGILRYAFENRHEVAPGVLRSAHPSPHAIAALAREGVGAIVNLRGSSDRGSHLLEREACERHGIRLVDIRLTSVRAPLAMRMLELIALFRSLEKPFLMHCKSGADRAGLAAAVYLLAVEGRPVEEARRQLALKFLHFRHSKTGVLDAFFEAYRRRNAASPIGFEDWLREEYDRDAVISAYRSNRLLHALTFSAAGRE